MSISTNKSKGPSKKLSKYLNNPDTQNIRDSSNNFEREQKRKPKIDRVNVNLFESNHTLTSE